MIRRLHVFLLTAFLFSVTLSACEIGSLRLPGNKKEPVDEFLTTCKQLYSYGLEECIIRDFFQDRQNGFFVDIGCAHYEIGSTTYYLEKHLSWAGIAVDAQGQYKAAYEKERSKTQFFQYIISDHSGSVESFYKIIEHPGVSSVSKQYAESQVETYRSRVEVLEVPTITLTALLDQNGITQIDFLSMDIEESEPEALAGFDIRRFKPKFVCIEPAPDVQKRILAYFTLHRYERIDKYDAYDGNWYFAPKNH
ncbi:FkbM family methyltransferase [Thermodesulfobacteriota bacterium]